MSIKIEVPTGDDDLTEFIVFSDRANEQRSAAWPALVPYLLPVLKGESPFVQDRTMRPFVARDGSEIVARVLAVSDLRYQKHWNESLGHISLFEALPDTTKAVRLVVDAASEWLEEQGLTAARCGFGAPNDWSFTTDAYESLPPSFVRQNPPYYHSLLKEARFFSERGWVDYKIKVEPDLLKRWKDAVEAARSGGFELKTMREVPEDRLVKDFVGTWNDAFKAHWGVAPFLEEEFSLVVGLLEPLGMLDASVIAYKGDQPVGTVWVVPEMSGVARLAEGRTLDDSEKLNTLGIAVRESARGKGVNLAMAGLSYLHLVEQGAKYVSYTMVLDDNWPSRRTAEKLGAYACANYLVYRREFHRKS